MKLSVHESRLRISEFDSPQSTHGEDGSVAVVLEEGSSFHGEGDFLQVEGGVLQQHYCARPLFKMLVNSNAFTQCLGLDCALEFDSPQSTHEEDESVTVVFVEDSDFKWGLRFSLSGRLRTTAALLRPSLVSRSKSW